MKIYSLLNQYMDTIRSINDLQKFIANHEKSQYNPMYYIDYPAKTSVGVAKIQLIAAMSSLKVLEPKISSESKKYLILCSV